MFIDPNIFQSYRHNIDIDVPGRIDDVKKYMKEIILSHFNTYYPRHQKLWPPK